MNPLTLSIRAYICPLPLHKAFSEPFDQTSEPGFYFYSVRFHNRELEHNLVSRALFPEAREKRPGDEVGLSKQDGKV